MNRLITALAATCLTALVALTGCHRPSESECRKAILNIRKLQGSQGGTDQEVGSAISACQGNATKKSVHCFAEAQSIEELKSCEGDMYKQMYGDEDKKKAAEKAAKEQAAPPAPAAPAKPAPAQPTGDGAAVSPEAPPAAAPAQPTGGAATPAKADDQPAAAAPKPAAPKPATPAAGGNP